MLFKKSQHGWRLMGQSLKVMQAQKKLWIFPLIGRGFFFAIIVATTLMVWALRAGKIDYQALSSAQVLWGYIVLLLLLWFANGFSAFFNAAFIACLIQKENGATVSVRKGLQVATSRLSTIGIWILAHFTLGIFLMIFRSKFTQSGRVNQLLSGLNWAFATYLLLPVIINERTDFLQSLQRSSQLMHDFAGANPKVNYSFTGVSLILRLLCLIPLFTGEVINQSVWIIAGIVITGLLLLSVMMIFNAVYVLIPQGLYQYMAHGKITHDFKADDLATAITP